MNIRYCSISCGTIEENKRRANPNIRMVDKKGYVTIRHNGKYMREHRKVMEEFLGRKLKTHEQVHHINGVKGDNRLENLQIVDQKKHYGDIECPYCQRIFKIK